MKKIGREVLFLKAGGSVSRMGEGGFARLKDGTIVYAYTKYDESWNDHASADIWMTESHDEGETWKNDRLLLAKDPEARNYMSISFLRMNNGDLGMFYLRKDEKYNCNLYLVRSADEGKTWSDPVCTNSREGYFVTNNDRVVRLKNGTILYPANSHRLFGNGKTDSFGEMCIFASYDDGCTWEEICSGVTLSELRGISRTGLQETGLYEREDGTLRAWARTDLFCQYECFSEDGGRTWTKPVPNPFFSSPASPMQMKRIGKYTIAIFNPLPSYTTRDESGTWGRTPYVCAVSENDGESFERVFYLEDDFSNAYCYPALIECEGGFLAAYYHSNDSGIALNSTRIKKILFSETES